MRKLPHYTECTVAAWTKNNEVFFVETNKSNITLFVHSWNYCQLSKLFIHAWIHCQLSKFFVHSWIYCQLSKLFVHAWIYCQLSRFFVHSWIYYFIRVRAGSTLRCVYVLRYVI